MCLITIKSYADVIADIETPVLTEKDKIVYKVLELYTEGDDKIYRSPIYGMRYQKGIHYYQTGKPRNRFGITSLGHWTPEPAKITVGLHAFLSKKAAKQYIQDAGLYGIGMTIVRMVVPAGSIIIQGCYGQIVTDNLIWY